MGGQIEIRELVESDAKALWQLRLEALEQDPLAFGESVEEHRATAPEMVPVPLRSGRSNGSFVVGAYVGSQLIGMAGFIRSERLKSTHKGRVWGVYVTKHNRGKGIGRALLSELIRRARLQLGLEQIILSVNVKQPAAEQLYVSLGFKIYGHERHSLKVDGT